MSRQRNAWNYVDARDLGEIVHLCLETDGLGYQVFNAANDHPPPTCRRRRSSRRIYPDTPITHEIGEHEAPKSNRKIREVLGFEQEHDWCCYVKDH